MVKYSMDTKKEIWDDESGTHLEIGPDRDGLDLIEIREYNSDNKIEARISFDKEQAVLIAQAIGELTRKE